LSDSQATGIFRRSVTNAGRCCVLVEGVRFFCFLLVRVRRAGLPIVPDAPEVIVLPGGRDACPLVTEGQDDPLPPIARRADIAGAFTAAVVPFCTAFPGGQAAGA